MMPRHLSNEELVQLLKDLVDVQSSPGTYDYSPYMHGLANGLILALSVVQGTEPEYLESPSRWIEDAEILDKFNKSDIVLQPIDLQEEKVSNLITKKT